MLLTPGTMFSKHGFQGRNDFAEGRAGRNGLEDCRHDVAVLRGVAAKGLEARRRPRGVTPGLERGELLDLVALDVRIDREKRRRGRVLLAEGVDPDDRPAPVLDLPLGGVGRLLDLPRERTVLDGGDGPAEIV